MTTYQLLQMLPERREAGRGVEELIEEIGPDVAWVRRTTRWRDSRVNPRPIRDWLTWRNNRDGFITFEGDESSIVAIYRRRYSEDAIEMRVRSYANLIQHAPFVYIPDGDE